MIPKASGTVHESVWKPTMFSLSGEEIAKWDWLKSWREKLLPALEKERQEKRIGKALDAKAEIVVPAAQLKQADGESLRELVNVSALKVSAGDADAFTVSKADGQKCERCWHWETDIGQNAEHPTICGRCVKAVLEFKGKNY